LDFDFREVRVSQAIIRGARTSVLVADASKFQRTAPVRVVSISDLDMFVTDSQPSDFIATLCRESATKIEIA
ncbi:MAG: DeoR family transcriptional regulator, partial [Pseudomonadota bacterium]